MDTRIISKTILPFQKVTDIGLDKSGTYSIVVEKGGVYTGIFLLRGQSLKMQIHLKDKDARCVLKAVYLSGADIQNQLDFKVIHESPMTYSAQEVRGVLNQNGRTIYDGQIQIPVDSQKCEGTQNHRAILLSDEAFVRCTPELEIFADDVKCAHGSAVGSLDERQVFYMQTRGICQKDAQKMIIQGFLSETVESHFQKEIEEWMIQNE